MNTPTRTGITPPEACQTMQEVREGVDALDRELVALIAQRARYMEAAARIKPSRDVVRDEWRINDVISKVSREAQAIGLAVEIAEPVWRELVERSIAYEFSVWDATR
ncbi:chorismate mutase [Maricaulis sp.]|uniref:chorismate mutase n=1 Tax=Maricaulis sp. TaxID=1486257 RepID=UPI0025C4B747|nr:chorismate mutase [Maricaulis sp.]